MKKIVALVGCTLLVGTTLITAITPKLSQLELRNKINKLEQAIKNIRMPKVITAPMTRQIQRDLGIVSRSIDSIKKDVIVAVAEKPVTNYNAQQALTDIQRKIDTTYTQLKTMTIQQRAQALADIQAKLATFQENLKKSLTAEQLKRLADLEMRIYNLANEAQKVTIRTIKQKVAHLTTDLENLKTLGLQSEAQELNAKIEAFKESKETNEANLKNEAAALYAKVQEAYKKAIKK